MNDILGRHDLLLASSDRAGAQQAAFVFMERNELVRYDSLQVERDAVVNATDPQFFARIEQGVERNRQTIQQLVRELQAESAADPQGWPDLQQGYTTKILHTLVHLLDGFIGIDSALYNLIDNSHQVTPGLLDRIEEDREKFWIVPVIGTTGERNPDRVQALRPFGREQE